MKRCSFYGAMLIAFFFVAVGCRMTGRRGSEDLRSGDNTEAKSPRRGLLYGGGGDAESELQGKLPWPVVGEISSHFGRRWGRLHAGIDIRAKRGTPIRAAASGRVIFSGRQGDYGNFILIEHGGFRTAYAHCHKLYVRRGDTVKMGDTIAAVGASGNASGNHLHFEYRTAADEPQDPLQHLKPRNLLTSI